MRPYLHGDQRTSSAVSCEVYPVTFLNGAFHSNNTEIWYLKMSHIHPSAYSLFGFVCVGRTQ